MDSKKFRNGIHLQPLSADPTSPEEGDIYVSDGTARPKGLYIYKDGNWTKAGGGAGDADTIHLIRAADTSLNDFTIKSIDDILPDPEGSDTLTGTLSIPSSGGEALLSNDDAHKVFKYASAASSQYDAFGISKAIPAYARGKDLVVQFKYRTADTSGASANADYMVWIWDETNGVNTTTSSSGSISAGTAITLGTTTGMAVGDKIWVGETGGTAQVTEAHITEVVSGTQIKISETVNLTSGDRFVTGMLTDVLTTMDAADDDTDLTGTDFKVVFLPPSNCASVAIIFQQLTSQTDSFLYVDNILVSSELVKKVSTIKAAQPQIKLLTGNTSSSGTLTDLSFSGLVIGKKYRISGSLDYTSNTNTTTNNIVWTNGATQVLKIGIGYYSASTENHTYGNSNIFTAEAETVSATFTRNSGTLLADKTYAILEEIPEVNDMVIVESTDSVMSEWTSYTPTIAGFGTVSNASGKWRRVGDSMEIRAFFTSGTPAASAAKIGLPSGYSIDTNKVDTGVNRNMVGYAFRVASGQPFDNSASYEFILFTNGTSDLDSVYMARAANSNTAFNADDGSSIVSASESVTCIFTVPIAGWDANPKPLLALPTITYGQDAEQYRANTHAGFGSTATKIPYYSNVAVNTISNLGSVTNDSTNGFSFTASRRCKVTAVYSLMKDSTGADVCGWSLNASSTTTSFENLTGDEPKGATTTDAGNGSMSPTFIGILNPGDILRPHTQGGAPTASSAYSNNISILVEPEEGQVNQAAIISQPVAFIKDVKASGTDGGDFTSGAWQTRDLNTLSGDIAAVGVTLSSNQFTLPAGKYLIEASVPAYYTNYTKALLYNVTDGLDQIIGDNIYLSNTISQSDGNTVKGVLTITSSKTFEIRQRCSTTRNFNGFGIASTFGVDEVYTQVKITRLK